MAIKEDKWANCEEEYPATEKIRDQVESLRCHKCHQEGCSFFGTVVHVASCWPKRKLKELYLHVDHLLFQNANDRWPIALLLCFTFLQNAFAYTFTKVLNILCLFLRESSNIQTNLKNWNFLGCSLHVKFSSYYCCFPTYWCRSDESVHFTADTAEIFQAGYTGGAFPARILNMRLANWIRRLDILCTDL